MRGFSSVDEDFILGLPLKISNKNLLVLLDKNKTTNVEIVTSKGSVIYSFVSGLVNK